MTESARLKLIAHNINTNTQQLNSTTSKSIDMGTAAPAVETTIGKYFTWNCTLSIVLLRQANVIRPFKAAGKQDTMQKRWTVVAEAMRKQNPVLYAKVTHQNTDRQVKALVIAWEQRNTASEKLTGENKQDSALDAMVEEYANTNTTETLSKKRPLRMGNEDEDWTAEDITNRKKRGRTATDARSSLLRLEELRKEDTQEKEGYLAIARQAEERRMKELELKERKLAVEEEQVKLATANQQMMMEMFKSFVSQKQ
ncbi:hypothetical protein HDU93_001165 [Gonapodya sp. JEL0774]|nr:hypothetical protein HDU93_001165 [Gonapodya sp. JEL0774]